MRLRENPPPGFRIVEVYPEWQDEAEDEVLDRLQDLADQGEALFGQAGIRLAHYEEPALVGVIPGNVVVGAIFGGNRGPDDDAFVNVRFSAAVLPAYRRTGVWRALAKQYVRDMEVAFSGVPGAKLEAWVVNPNTIPVLESLGFQHASGGDWSPGDPFFEKWLERPRRATLPPDPADDWGRR